MTFSRLVFLFSFYSLAAIGLFFYGVKAQTHSWPPLPQISWVSSQVLGVISPLDKDLFADPVLAEDSDPIEFPLEGQEQPGLIALSFDIASRHTVIRIVDRQGEIVHQWRPIWKEIWPKGEGNFEHRPVDSIFLHGLVILPDGSFVSNFEWQSTFRMDVCGDVMWQLDNLGHHSVDLASDGTLWVSAESPIMKGPTGLIAHRTPLQIFLLQQIDLDGNVLRTINLMEAMLNNGLSGLLFSRATPGPYLWTAGDTLHLNDVEAFPAGIDSPVFNEGDLVVSLANMNTLLVIDPNTQEIKWTYIGRTVRQHDPDFTRDGTISVHDNQTHLGSDPTQTSYSRIIEIDPETGALWTVIGGDADRPFFSRITGSHERLDNGNVLVAASQQGRVLEYTETGRLVWRYDARQSEMKNGRVYNVQMLPEHMDKAFFEKAKERCD